MEHTLGGRRLIWRRRRRRRRQLSKQFRKMFGQNGAWHRVLRQILGLYVFGIPSKNSVDHFLEKFRFWEGFLKDLVVAGRSVLAKWWAGALNGVAKNRKFLFFRIRKFDLQKCLEMILWALPEQFL